jgi:nicotinate-nucleotide adenylyltransferase
MTSMAVATNRHFVASEVECRRAERSYTVETARVLRDQHPDAELYFILGVDAFMELPMWREPEDLLKLLDFIIIGRPTMRFADLSSSPYINVSQDDLDGLDLGKVEVLTTTLAGGRSAVLLGSPLLDISSTAIRENIREGRSIKYMLPERVESFIITHGLYRGAQ